MAIIDDAARLSVSTYLLKKSKSAEAREQLAAVAASVHPLIGTIPGGAFIALPADTEAPRWLKPISELLASVDAPELTGQSPGAILWIPRGDKTFVFTFGHGHSKIKDEWIEPDFGRNVALAVVTQGQVRAMRAEQVFAKRHIANERAPRASAVQEFGFEADRDLVTAFEGIPESKYRSAFGKRVRGGVSFKFDLDIAKLVETLDKIIERFDSNDHRRRWPQANNLVLVRDDEKIQQLNVQLDGLLAGPNPDRYISLAAPSERSGDGIYPQHFVIGRKNKNAATSPYLIFATWQKYVLDRGEKISVKAAQETQVHLLDENKEEIKTCTMYNCIGAEIDLDGVTHVLTSGSWYAADGKFIERTNQILSTLDTPTLALKARNKIDNEGPYNADAAAANPDLWLFDKDLIYYGGGKSSFEYCDIMHLSSRTLYFVKHPSGSASVSHLCEQVRRTAELFFNQDPSYRKKLSEKIAGTGKNWPIDWLAERPKLHEWNLCLVLMGKHVKTLPFFAKCGIARLLSEQQRRGLKVSFQTV